MDKTKNKKTGNEGEEIAAKYLEREGYKILDRNLNLGFGEIDILAEFKKTIVICEVKRVRGEGFGEAKELVRYNKKNKLLLLGRAMEQRFPKQNIRIDVISIDHRGMVEHIKNAVISE